MQDEIENTALFRLGGSTVTVGELVAGVLVVAVAWIVATLLGRLLRRARSRAVKTARALYVLQKLTTYSILLFGVFAGLSTAGLNLSSLAVFAGAVGVGVGLGLQGVVKEFVSGIILIFDRMVSIGDYVELEGGVRGMVTEVGPRATRIRTNDNVNIILPNSHFIENRVTNWTLKGDTRRIHIPFSVAYGADKNEVREVVLAAARRSPFTLPETETRKSQVWLVGFGESGLDFELLIWPTSEAVKRPAAMHAAYTWAISDALDAAGIEIPFPQMDLRLRSVFGREGDAGLEAMGFAGKRKAPPPSPPPSPPPAGPSTNDAEQDLLQNPEPIPSPSEDTDPEEEKLRTAH